MKIWVFFFVFFLYLGGWGLELINHACTINYLYQLSKACRNLINFSVKKSESNILYFLSIGLHTRYPYIYIPFGHYYKQKNNILDSFIKLCVWSIIKIIYIINWMNLKCKVLLILVTGGCSFFQTPWSFSRIYWIHLTSNVNL